jgi:predicted negative regulator of RcsB-dependent stress response
MGWVKYRMGKLDESLDYLNRAYTAKTDPEIAAHLGEVLWAMGKRGEARTMWQGSLKENPGHETLMQVIKRLDH